MKYKVVSRTLQETEMDKSWIIVLEGEMPVKIRHFSFEQLTILRSFEDGQRYTIGSVFELTPCLSKNPGIQLGDPPDIL